MRVLYARSPGSAGGKWAWGPAAMLATLACCFFGFDARAGADAAPTPQETANVNASASPLDSALAGLQQSLGDLSDPGQISVKAQDGAPYRLLYVEGAAGIAPDDHPLLQHVRTVAQNHGLSLEYQHALLDDGAVLFGFLLFEPFEMLQFHWTKHPWEMNLQAIADWCDVASVQARGGHYEVTLTEGAARRLDRLSEIQGHCRILTRPGVQAWEFTWIPGLRTIAGLRLDDLAAPFSGLDAGLPDRVRIHAEARNQLREALGLPDDVSWYGPVSPGRYTEPVFFQALHDPARDGERSAFLMPALEPDSAGRRTWVELSGADARAPWPWLLNATPTGLALTERNSPADLEVNFFQFLKDSLGRRVALVVNGRIAGTFTVDSARPSLITMDLSPAAIQVVAAAWRSLGGPVEVPEQTARVPEPEAEAPDAFQVRLMAEPQDRKQVPVTHFAAPGAPGGVRVAVHNDIILDRRAVTGAQLEEKGGMIYLRLTLTPEGQKTLDGVCFGNMGKQLAILYAGRLLSAPTIDEWEGFELAFRGLDADWPEVAHGLAAYLGESPVEPEANAL